ncbi:MAG: hypothetical protein ACKO96_14270, partial [Flammeovirgaceae bacterium]
MIQQDITESEIDEMIKHLEEVEVTSLIRDLQSYKEIFVYLNKIFNPLFDKDGKYNHEANIYQLIAADSLGDLSKSWEEFRDQNKIVVKLKLLRAKKEEMLSEYNEIQQTLTQVTEKLREIHKKVLAIPGINGLLANILAENLYKTSSLYRRLEKQVAYNESETKNKIKELEEKLEEAKQIATDNTLQKESEHFKEEADKLAKNAQDWLGGIICLVLLLVLISIINIQTLDLNQLIPGLKDNNVFFVYIF